MAFGIESAIDPELLRQLQVGVSGFVLIMVLIMFHNVTSKMEKGEQGSETPSKKEIAENLRKAKSYDKT